MDDVDLFIGGVSERPVEDALVGPVFRCIITDQFARQKAGDRYFYEEGGQTGSFTLGERGGVGRGRGRGRGRVAGDRGRTRAGRRRRQDQGRFGGRQGKWPGDDRQEAETESGISND